jgi:hypothetical protein
MSDQRAGPILEPRVAFYALLVGLCALVPVPILDGWLARRALRAMYAAIADARGAPLPPESLDRLAEDRESLLVGCAWMAVVWPIKKLFRTVVFFLAAKDVIDGVAAAALRAAMLDAGLARAQGDARVVRDLMDATLDRWYHSPVNRFVLRGERPASAWVAPRGLGVVVGWLYRHAGGGVIVPDFVKRLESTP